MLIYLFQRQSGKSAFSLFNPNHLPHCHTVDYDDQPLFLIVMLVDSPRQQPWQFSATNNPVSFDEFFNLDLNAFDAPSSSSKSPAPSSPLIVNQDSESFFNLCLADEYAKDPLQLGMMSMPPSHTTSALVSPPFDFLSDPYSGMPSGSSSSSSGDGSPPSLVSPHFAIDPQLVGSPSTVDAPSEFGGEGDIVEEGEEDRTIPTIKIGGGSRFRNRLVLGGGIVKSSASIPIKDKENTFSKRNTISSVVATGPKSEDDFAEDWRPTPEEYKRMSSKEKRQLRNKISARNFRVRRKEYITTLEADISERDRLLSTIRSELGTMRSENADLRREVASLKKALLDGRGGAPSLPPPAPLRSSTPVPAAQAPAPAPTSALLTPNTQKDLPTSPRVSSRAFWGGVDSGLGNLGGITSVHTALIPEPSPAFSLLWGKKSLLENMNPTLNARSSSPHGSQISEKLGGFDTFSDSNAFTFSSFDQWREQLWNKMATQSAPQQRQRSQQSTTPTFSQPPRTPLITGHTLNIRPHYFQHHGSAVGMSGILSGKSASPTASPSSSSRPLSNTTNLFPSSSSGMPTLQPTKEQAVIAAIASQTLLGRLGNAFWDAFSGSTNAAPGAPGGKSALWDADKVRKVLEGKAVVRVVDLEPETSSGPPPPSPSLVFADKKKCHQCLADVLAESMGGLNLGKK